MLDYTRQPLLKPEVEADLKLKMEPLWLQEPRLSGMQIAKQLKFGQPKNLLNCYSPGMFTSTDRNSIYHFELNRDSKRRQ